MPKIFITSNTLFGYKSYIGFNRFLEESEKYFNQELIPFLHKYAKPDDTFVHLGGFFASKQNLNVKIINTTQNILEKISTILPVYLVVGEHDRYQSSNNLNNLSVFKNIKNVSIVSTEQILYNEKVLICSYSKSIDKVIKMHHNMDYLLFANRPMDIFDYQNRLSTYKKVYTGYDKSGYIENNITSVSSPYQIEPNTQNKGIYVLDLDKGLDKFLPNGTSTKFRTVHLDTINDLISLDKSIFETNFVDIVVSKELYENNEFRIKLSEYDIQSLTYKEVDNPEETIDDVSDIFNVDELILTKVQDDDKLKLEFDNVIKIYNQEG